MAITVKYLKNHYYKSLFAIDFYFEKTQCYSVSAFMKT